MIRIKAAITWTKEWALLWIAWFFWTMIPFVILEAIGLIRCEWGKVPGCSTLSSWMVSNWGEVFLSCATVAAASMFIWHWITVKQEQDKQKAIEAAVDVERQACIGLASDYSTRMNLAPESTKLDAAYAEGWNRGVAHYATAILERGKPA